MNMSLLTPRTIVITTTNQSSNSSKMMTTTNTTVLDDDDDDDYSEMMDSGEPRKRRRLTHLSPDEKFLRRKLKNRVAAQTARDRKKAQMSDMEITIAKLEAENKRLQEENFALKVQSDSLVTQNSELQDRLGQCDLGKSVLVATSDKLETKSNGSAAGTDFDSTSLGEAVQGMYHDTQHPAVISLLQQGGKQTINCQQKTKTASPVSPHSHQYRTNSSQSAGGTLVGPTSAELESLNELIKFDHIYYKPDSSDSSTVHSTPEDKRPSQMFMNGKPVVVKIVDKATNTSKNCALLNSQLEDAKTKNTSQDIVPINSQIDDVKTTLNELTMDNCVDLQLWDDLESFINDDLLALVEGGQTEFISQENNCSKISDAEKSNSRKRKIARISEDISDGCLSDSGVGSDSEALSPKSDVSSVGSEDDLWQDSFGELFPDLNYL